MPVGPDAVIVPLATVSGPLKVLEAVRIRFPAPALVKPCDETLEINPLSVTSSKFVSFEPETATLILNEPVPNPGFSTSDPPENVTDPEAPRLAAELTAVVPPTDSGCR